MDFDLNEEQQAISDLAEQILADKSTHARLKELTAADDHVDREAWEALARSGVVGCSLPEEHGGAGLGFLATAAAMERAGFHASPVPLLSTVVMAAMPIAEFGTDSQKKAYLPAIADGSLLAAGVFHQADFGESASAATATPDGTGWRLDGVESMADGGLDAGLLLVSARTPDGARRVFLVDPETNGVVRTKVETTTGHPRAHIRLEAVGVGEEAVLGGDDVDAEAIIEWITQRAQVGMCMTMAGSARASIELAAQYTKERFQFDRAIATFQTVSNRAGDSYIDTEAIRLTALQAAWRLDAGIDAADQIHIARWWAAEGGFRVVHAAVHVHGGVGVDRDYPMHRHFLLARQLELTLGTGEEHLAALGRSIATRQT